MVLEKKDIRGKKKKEHRNGPFSVQEQYFKKRKILTGKRKNVN